MQPRRIFVVLSASGNPGGATLIRMLKRNGERDIRIIAVDSDEEAARRFLADDFYVVPPFTQADDYLEAMLRICKRQRADILFPQHTGEVLLLSEHVAEFEAIGTRVMVSSAPAVRLALNKYLLYEAAAEVDVPVPEHVWPRSLDEFVNCVYDLGYPHRPVCFKPHVGEGSRGFRIFDGAVSRRRLLMEEKPNSRYMALEDFVSIFEAESDFPNFLVMEFLEESEVATDVVCLDGEELLTAVRTVEAARWGVTVRGELVRRPDLVEYTSKILEAVPLSYCVNFQFVGDRLIEANPRPSTFIYQHDLIFPYVAIKLALGEMGPEEVRAKADRLACGIRHVRYMDQVFF